MGGAGLILKFGILGALLGGAGKIERDNKIVRKILDSGIVKPEVVNVKIPDNMYEILGIVTGDGSDFYIVNSNGLKRVKVSGKRKKVGKLIKIEGV